MMRNNVGNDRTDGVRPAVGSGLRYGLGAIRATAVREWELCAPL